QGMRKVAELCYHKAHYIAEQITALEDYSLWYDGPFFHEFVVNCPRPVTEINNRLLDYDILGGYDLGKDYPSLENRMLIVVTEVNSKEEIDDLISALEEITHD
ncbi:MAG: glycine dehydrogenase, partial [Anaerolineales bacterium]